MWCYFLSKKLCALKINGEFIGYVGDNLCKTQITCEGKNEILNGRSDNFFEFIPICGKYSPVTFCKELEKTREILNKQFTENFCADLRIIDLCGELLFLPKFFKRAFFNATDLKSEKLGDGVNATVFCFNGLYLFLESNGKSEFFSIGDEFSSIEFKLLENGFLLLKAASDDKKRFYLFNVSAAPALVLVRDGDECYFEKNTLTVIKKNLGVCKIERRESFDLEKPENSYRAFLRETPIFNLNENLLPYAFLEEVYLGANFEDYLSRDLKENKQYIPEFIGDFEFFLPPVVLGGGIVLIKKDKQKAEFLSLKIKNGCIVDINYL